MSMKKNKKMWSGNRSEEEKKDKKVKESWGVEILMEERVIESRNINRR